jgi:hypothetical protein
MFYLVNKKRVDPISAYREYHSEKHHASTLLKALIYIDSVPL